MSKFRILISLLIAIGAIFFALRYRALQQLKSEQTQLQRQSNEVASPPALEARPESAAAPVNAGLSADEQSELLRLRGQVGMLRRELAQESNQLAAVSRTLRPASPGAPEDHFVSREESVQKMTQGKQWMVALILYASDNQGRFPAAMTDASSYFGSQTAGGADNFEFVLGGALTTSIGSPSRTIVLREKKPWKRSPDSRWNRTYAFADGHIENAVSDTEDFTAWEEEKTKPPAGNPDAENAGAVR